MIVRICMSTKPTLIPPAVKFKLGVLMVNGAWLLPNSSTPMLIAEEPDPIELQVTLPLVEFGLKF